MFVAVKLQVSRPVAARKWIHHNGFDGNLISLRRRYTLRPQLRRALPTALLVHESASSSPTPPPPRPPLYSASSDTSEPSTSSRLTSSGGFPSLQLSQRRLTQRHIILLNVIACAAAVSATWLFFAAIPALRAFKKAAESLEKLMDVTREELPDTMAAIRLSGMEISDLTMELSDLGQDITRGVRSSTRAVRLAEERLQRLTNIGPAFVQEAVYHNKMEEVETGPVVARTVRNLREGIVKGRALWQLFFTITRLSKIAFNYFAKRARQ